MQWLVPDPPPKIPTPEALRSISAAIEAQPHLPALRAFRAGMMMRLGRPDAAIADFTAAMNMDPRGAGYTTQIATCHLRARRPEAALEVCDSRKPNGPDHAWSLQRGRALLRLGRTAEGQGELKRALRAEDPGFSALRSLLPTYGRTGDGAALLAFCDSLEPRHAETAGARGYRAVALSLLGRTRDALDLVDLDRCIVRLPFEPPAGFGGIEAFNRALAEEILAAMPEASPERHVDYLTTVRPDPARTALMGFVKHAVEDYVAHIPERGLGAALPFVPRVAELTSGSVVLRGDAGQAEHLHPTGYLSCVYHVAVPGSAVVPDGGALSVGGCASQFAGHQPVWGTRTIMPEPGWLILIPSHVFHAVLPTRSREPRITVPSDVRPVRP